jgi:hypothetical protein
VSKGWKTKEGSNGNHSKIYTHMDGKTYFFEIITGYYFHTMLLDASACKKRIPKVSKIS